MRAPESRRESASNEFGVVLAQDGMLVLAASQSDAVALESQNLGHGLLTWVLVEEGLRGGRADTDADGQVRLKEWLSFAEARVPQVADAVLRGEAMRGARGEPVKLVSGNSRFVDVGLAQDPEENSERGPAPPAQQPRLFSYGTAGQTVVQRTK